jgi:excisionase family DNA binding protein
MSEENFPAGILAFKTEDAARALSLGRGKILEMMREGVLRSVMIGGKRLIPRSELERLLAEGDGSATKRGQYKVEARRAREATEQSAAAEASAKDEGGAS